MEVPSLKATKISPSSIVHQTLPHTCGTVRETRPHTSAFGDEFSDSQYIS
jgi:hypothetical protein